MVRNFEKQGALIITIHLEGKSIWGWGGGGGRGLGGYTSKRFIREMCFLLLDRCTNMELKPGRVFNVEFYCRLHYEVAFS